MAGAEDTSPLLPRQTLMSRVISTVYSGPTIEDVEAAMAMSYGKNTTHLSSHGGPRATIAWPEKGLNKMEGKYALRVKCCASEMTDDGYKWRKYGQKSIKNNPYPRSYYRCTNPRCHAKKQVERSADEPEMLVVTYEGLHLHYSYSHLLLPRPGAASTASPAVKKAKVEGAAPQPWTPESPRRGAPKSTGLNATPQPPSPRWVMVGEGSWQELQGAEDGSTPQPVQRGEGRVVESSEKQLENPIQSSQGLLEDVVPFLVRKPCSNSSTISSDPAASLSSMPSSSPSSSSSPFSWLHASSFFDLDMMSVASSSPPSPSSSPFSWLHASSSLDMGMLSE